MADQFANITFEVCNELMNEYSEIDDPEIIEEYLEICLGDLEEFLAGEEGFCCSSEQEMRKIVKDKLGIFLATLLSAEGYNLPDKIFSSQ